MAKAKDNYKIIVDGYLDYVLKKEKRPNNVYLFVKEIGIDEGEFYPHFTSIDAIDSEIWNNLLSVTLDRLKADKIYEEYSVREKLLAFYYTFFEMALDKRSYIIFLKDKCNLFSPFSHILEKMKDGFDDYVKDLIKKGVAENEVEDRKMLTDKYYLGFWAQFVFVLYFWSGDTSKKFEQSDAAIEKAVNLSFDFLAKNPLDSLFDFGKFVIQSKTGL